MEIDDQETRGPGRPSAALARMPTGAKVFLILSGALLPLALIAVFATLQTTRLADVDTRARLNVAARESARALSIELVGDMEALRVALDTLDADPQDTPSCAKLEGVFAQQAANGMRFGVVDRRGALLCGDRPEIVGPAPTSPGRAAVRLVDDRGLVATVGSTKGSRATAFFPAEVLNTLGRPSGFMPAYGATLIHGQERLSLQDLPRESALERREAADIPLELDSLVLQMTVRSAPITSPLIIALMLPLLMWALAALIGWFVVDRLLIRPLRRLRSTVGSFQPGEVIDPQRFGPLPAQEIRELGETFRDISRTVQAHEAELAEGLVRQTRLTREVHHRVKNNLQVIASLINFHSRGASSREANEAYSSIQRRVDALAVVHRYHYAEMEENRGLELRSVIGELASNIRATAPEHSGLGITLEIEPFLVSQDVAVAVAFLITELVELALSVNQAAQIRISVRSDSEPDRAMVRVSSPALIEGPQLQQLLDTRYGRVIGGLVRQLRTRMHHDPLVGAYEMSIAVTGRY
jgi:two-component system, sensor histidine kinase PdtaS